MKKFYNKTEMVNNILYYVAWWGRWVVLVSGFTWVMTPMAYIMIVNPTLTQTQQLIDFWHFYFNGVWQLLFYIATVRLPERFLKDDDNTIYRKQ